MYDLRSREGQGRVKAKLWSQNEAALLEVLDNIRSLYPTNCDVSRLLHSDKGGAHAFITIYTGDR